MILVSDEGSNELKRAASPGPAEAPPSRVGRQERETVCQRGRGDPQVVGRRSARGRAQLPEARGDRTVDIEHRLGREHRRCGVLVAPPREVIDPRFVDGRGIEDLLQVGEGARALLRSSRWGIVVIVRTSQVVYGRSLPSAVALGRTRAPRRAWQDRYPVGMISPRIDRLLENVDSNYASVLVAAKRARQINSYYHNLGEGTFDEFPPPMVDTGSKNYLTIALEEVAAGKIKYQYR
jgi:DNA-directed RNA polymerase subunit omega